MPAASCDYAVVFSPTILGNKTASIAIAHNAGAGTTAVALSGVSQATPASITQEAVTYALNAATAAVTLVQNFIASTYPTITFDPQTQPRVIAPSTPAVAPPSTVVTSNQRQWSDASLWGGSLPGAGAAVVIPAGTTVILDQSTPALGAITINGTLKFARQDLSLSATKIDIASTGALQIGEPGAPFTDKAIITLTGAKGAGGPNVNMRGITGSCQASCRMKELNQAAFLRVSGSVV